MFSANDRVELSIPGLYHPHGTVTRVKTAVTRLPQFTWVNVQWDAGHIGCYHEQNLKNINGKEEKLNEK